MSKTKTEKIKLAIFIIASAFLIIGTESAFNEAQKFSNSLAKRYNLCDYIGGMFAKPENYLKVNRANAEEELPMKEWVKMEIEKAGIDWTKAEKIIQCESRWDTNAHNVNWENKAGVDRGLWQISSLYHKEVSNAEAYDYKKATEHAIRIYKERGNWSAWACSAKLK